MLYGLAEHPTDAEYKAVGKQHHRKPWDLTHGVRCQRTGEFREPRKGEWYLSGAIAQGWRAPNDLSTKYHIVKLVRKPAE